MVATIISQTAIVLGILAGAFQKSFFCSAQIGTVSPSQPDQTIAPRQLQACKGKLNFAKCHFTDGRDTTVYGQCVLNSFLKRLWCENAELRPTRPPTQSTGPGGRRRRRELPEALSRRRRRGTLTRRRDTMAAPVEACATLHRHDKCFLLTNEGRMQGRCEQFDHGLWCRGLRPVATRPSGTMPAANQQRMHKLERQMNHMAQYIKNIEKWAVTVREEFAGLNAKAHESDVKVSQLEATIEQLQKHLGSCKACGPLPPTPSLPTITQAQVKACAPSDFFQGSYCDYDNDGQLQRSGKLRSWGFCEQTPWMMQREGYDMYCRREGSGTPPNVEQPKSGDKYIPNRRRDAPRPIPEMVSQCRGKREGDLCHGSTLFRCIAKGCGQWLPVGALFCEDKEGRKVCEQPSTSPNPVPTTTTTTIKTTTTTTTAIKVDNPVPTTTTTTIKTTTTTTAAIKVDNPVPTTTTMALRTIKQRTIPVTPASDEGDDDNENDDNGDDNGDDNDNNENDDNGDFTDENGEDDNEDSNEDGDNNGD